MIPAMSRSSVVFPAPLSPESEMSAPGADLEIDVAQDRVLLARPAFGHGPHQEYRG